jgi:hypothetical protein
MSGYRAELMVCPLVETKYVLTEGEMDLLHSRNGIEDTAYPYFIHCGRKI